MTRIAIGNPLKPLVLGLMFGLFTLGTIGCELGSEPEEVGEEEREGVVEEEGAGEED